MSNVKTSNVKQTPMSRNVAVTSFDFLNGAYKRSANARLAVLTLIGAVLAAAMLVFLYGANNMLQASTAREEAELAFSEQLTASQQLTSVSSSGGLSEEDMLSHLEKRTAKALEIAKTSPSFSTLLKDLQTVAPAGISVTSLSVGGEDAKAANSVTIVAQGSGHSYVKPWQNALATIEYLKVGAPTWTNAGESGLTISVTATINPELDTKRHDTIALLLGAPVSEGAQS